MSEKAKLRGPMGVESESPNIYPSAKTRWEEDQPFPHPLSKNVSITLEILARREASERYSGLRGRFEVQASYATS